jgi:hypothetical protein
MTDISRVRHIKLPTSRENVLYKSRDLRQYSASPHPM